MAGIPHDTLLLALRDNPALLAQLLQRLAGLPLPGPLEVTDSVIRSTRSLETSPDLVLTTRAPSPGWLLVEIQNRKDDTKGRSWHLATSVLLQGGVMGDVVVLTASRSVARWAKHVAQHRGALGTTKALTPVVLHLSKESLAALLDPAAPDLALFAVWARCRGAGPEARSVARRALEVTAALPPELQEAQARAILAMLSKRLLDHLKELSMDVNQIKETRASRAFRLFFEERGKAEGKAEGLAEGKAEGLAEGKAEGLAEGKAEGFAEGLAEGKRRALFAVLAARGLTPTAAERRQLIAVTDLEVLDRCLHAAATCSTVAALLPHTGARPAPRPRTPGTNGHRH